MSKTTRIEPLERRVLLVAGGVDPYFGAGGVATVLDSARFRRDAELVVDGRGNIITAVESLAQSEDVLLHVRRFTANGDPDPRFTAAVASGGELRIELPTGGSVDVAATSDGGFVVISGKHVLRFEADGSPDRDFGAEGRVTIDSFSSTAIGVLPGGKILATGSRAQHTGAEQRFAIVRLNPDGSPDTTFGVGGMREVAVANIFGPNVEPERTSATGHHIVVAPDGSAYVAGTYSSVRFVESTDEFDNPELFEDERYGLLVARLNPDGTFDQRFDDDGVRQIGFDYGRAEQTTEVDVHALQFLTDASLAADGTLRLVAESPPRAAVFRLGPDGAVEQVPPPAYPAGSTQGLLDALSHHDGKLLIAKLRFVSGQTQYELSRVNPDGSVDAFYRPRDRVDLDGPFSLKMARDGSTLLLADERANDGSTKLVLRRLWRDDGPVAELQTVDITAATTRSQVFTVTYRDDRSVATSSLDNRDLRVTGPDGYVAYAKFDRVVRSKSGGGWVQVRYKLAAPGGSWDTVENGTYSIRLGGNSVFDNNANAAQARTIGKFVVNVRAVQARAARGAIVFQTAETDDELNGWLA